MVVLLLLVLLILLLLTAVMVAICLTRGVQYVATASPVCRVHGRACMSSFDRTEILGIIESQTIKGWTSVR